MASRKLILVLVAAKALEVMLLFPPLAFADKKPVTKKEKKEPKGQRVPSPQRVAEIRAALIAHGYNAGPSWSEVQEVCRKIQDEHLWQVDHAPDARVLGLIGLGGDHFDPSILVGANHLDEAQRKESARRKAAGEKPL